MQIYEVTDPEFKKYGKIVKNIDFTQLVEEMQNTPLETAVEYQPSVASLEALDVMKELSVKFYGEMPIQIGYCNGHNTKLNAFEYHRSSEINVAATDAVLILGLESDINDDFTYDTSKAVAFHVPKGMAVEVYASTLHYAPCDVNDEGFRVTIVLPKGTNYPLEGEHDREGEDRLLTATNKWLIAHKDGGVDGDPFIGLVGENLDISK